MCVSTLEIINELLMPSYIDLFLAIVEIITGSSNRDERTNVVKYLD